MSAATSHMNQHGYPNALAYSTKNDQEIFALSRPQKLKKSGITAIDLYYENLNLSDEVEHLRYSTEFKRLV